jgi:hypothetical protein
MTARSQEAEDVKEALEFMSELRKDPERFNVWADRVIDGWLKRNRGSRRRSQVSRRV